MSILEMIVLACSLFVIAVSFLAIYHINRMKNLCYNDYVVRGEIWRIRLVAWSINAFLLISVLRLVMSIWIYLSKMF